MTGRRPARASARLAWLLWVASFACGAPPPPAYTTAETERALAPARELLARCYRGGPWQRAQRSVRLSYQLDVAADGSVKAIPRFVDPDEPALVECTRRQLQQLEFPARGRDRLTVDFELGPSRASRSEL